MRHRILPVLFAMLVMAAACPPMPGRSAGPSTGADSFSRAVIGGWGTADAGGAWTIATDPGAFSVGAGWGTIALARAGSGRGAYQESIDGGDVELAARIRVDRLPDGGNAFAYLVGRHADDAEVRFKVRIDGDGSIFIGATGVVDETDVEIGDEVALPELSIGPDTAVRFRAQLVGSRPTYVRMRAWADGTDEPTEWPLQALSDSDELPVSGQVGLRIYVGGSVTTVPTAFGFDDWSARVIDARPNPTAAPTLTASPTPTAVPTDLPTASPGVSPPPLDPDPLAPVAADDFDRLSDRGWGTAPTGGRWSHAGAAVDFDVDEGRGRMLVVPGSTSVALLGASGRDVQTTVTLRPDQLPVGGNAWLYVVMRRSAAGDEVRGRIRITPDGAVHLGLSVMSAEGEQMLGPEIRPGALTTGPTRPIRIRVQGVGTDPTTWSIRAWAAGTAEPSDWALRVTDATPALQAAGTLGLRAYLGRSATNEGVRLLVDDYLALPATATSGTDDPVLAGAGDIAFCGRGSSAATAALLDQIPGTVFAVGDLAYPDGTPSQFAECFDPTWGRHKARMLPVLGNHEYATPGAAGYFGYFGEAAAGPGGYYVRDLGAWRVYVLNSDCREVACGEESAQLAWLQADLAAHPRTCSLALWHEPRFTSGEHGDTIAVAPLWEALYVAGVELVVSGHDHDYERLLPMAPAGRFDPAHGIVQFVAGTGGGGGAAFESVRANSAIRNGDTYGVLKLTLHPDSYDWHFIPVPGRMFTDSGSARCHGAP